MHGIRSSWPSCDHTSVAQVRVVVLGRHASEVRGLAPTGIGSTWMVVARKWEWSRAHKLKRASGAWNKRKVDGRLCCDWASHGGRACLRAARASSDRPPDKGKILATREPRSKGTRSEVCTEGQLGRRVALCRKVRVIWQTPVENTVAVVGRTLATTSRIIHSSL